jgi:hypothetical protein
MVADDATAGGSQSDDEKAQPAAGAISPAMLALIQGAPTAAPAKPEAPALKSKADEDEAAALMDAEMKAATTLGREARKR